MNEKEMPPEEEINLLDLLITVLKHKRLILILTFGAAVIATFVSLLLPPIYRAETKILPPVPTSSAASLMIQQQIQMVAPSLSLSVKNPLDTYIEILKSRTVIDRIIDRFDLMRYYRAKFREDARRSVLSALKAKGDVKSGIITIGFEDKDPRRASDIANAFVEELKNLNRELAIGEASQRRLFFEEQLREVKESLIRAEEAMKGFQEKTGALEIKEQTKAMIESVANLRAQIAAKEVQLKVMKTYTTEQNPDLQRLMEEVRGMKEQLARLEAKTGSHNPDPLMPAGRIPTVGTEYIRRYRDLKFREALYEILLKLYEAAKLDEAKEAPVIQVIERATPPERKIKPKIKLNAAVAMLSGFFVSIFAAFLLEYKERISKDPENKERLEVLRKSLRL